jgi:hypothetical protein
VYRDAEQIRPLIEAVIGGADNRNSSGDHDYRCPFCERNGYATPSHLHVNYHKNAALCHRCGYATKDLLYLIRALTGSVPRSLTTARLGLELSDYITDTYTRVHRPGAAGAGAVRLPDEFIPLPARPRDETGREVRRYLVEERGLDERMLEEVGVGYATTGRFAGYAIFPVHVGGVLVTYTSRLVTGHGPKAQHATGSRSKAAVFNYDTAAAMGAQRVFIGEGPFDGWAFHRRADPLDAGVALLGKVLHDEQARLLDCLPCEELCMCLDDTEHERTVRYASSLTRLTSKRISYILLPEGSGDPHENRQRLPRFIERRTLYEPMVTDVRRILDAT